jgi:poly-gamma-glutamate synthesis protein (capsule biosynthesis protein)
MTTPHDAARVTLAAAGDVCFGDHYVSLGHGVASRVAAGLDPFAELTLFRDADVAVGNLEAPLSHASSVRDAVEAAVFRGPPRAADVLDDAGFGVMHVANNHMLQHGERAFHESLDLLDARGIAFTGVADGAQSRPVVRTVNGLTLGFVGCSFVRERYMPGQRLYAAPTLDALLADVARLAARVDVAIVSVHWGVECTAVPSPEVRSAARQIVDAGATVVLGHHPHWFQPVERIGKALVAYSLGDLVFDLFWDVRCVESAVLRVELGAQGVLAHDVVPVRFDRDYRVRVQRDERARRFLAELDRNADRMRTDPAALQLPNENVERLRKLAWFLSQLPRGDVSGKMRFAAGKAARVLRATAVGSRAS